jgi:hypothetical protein
MNVFVTEREGASGTWRNCTEVNNLYSYLNINRVIKSRRMGWAVSVAGMGEMNIAIFEWKTCEEEVTWKTEFYVHCHFLTCRITYFNRRRSSSGFFILYPSCYLSSMQILVIVFTSVVIVDGKGVDTQNI